MCSDFLAQPIVFSLSSGLDLRVEREMETARAMAMRARAVGTPQRVSKAREVHQGNARGTSGKTRMVCQERAHDMSGKTRDE